MVDFFIIATRSSKKGLIEIYPKFLIKKSSDLMIRGGDFYAVWLEDKQLWSTDEDDVVRIVDKALDEYAEANRSNFESSIRVLHMWDSESGVIDSFHKYCQKQMRDNFHMLDERLIFANTETKKEDYASKRLPYPLEKGPIDAYDELISTLYSQEERLKIEWAIGSIVSGDSRFIQKFLVLYGSAGTGKSTLLNIIQMLFDGYYSVFDAKALGSTSNAFALEAFKTNPLVAIQHDGDLSKIEDNTRINSLVSHEIMTVNEKFKSTYANRFKCFLFMGTNKPVRITDAKSGLVRRLIDVSPTGNKLDISRYNKLVRKIPFELGGIASHCLDIYNNNKTMYDSYIPLNMLGASNDFYNFVLDNCFTFEGEGSTTLKAAWEMYKTYCEDAKVNYPLSLRAFKEELKNYFHEFRERFILENGDRVRNYYVGFRSDKFVNDKVSETNDTEDDILELNQSVSILDDILKDRPAQYASQYETPTTKWAFITTTLSSLNTKELHYVKPPLNHIVIDFDIKDENGNKSLEKNLKEAAKWPKTYAELSKSGYGVHLHYIYTGNVEELSNVVIDNVEIKVFTGNSSLRRKLTKCNDIPVATLSSGLPIKEKKVVSANTIKTEKSLRKLLLRNLHKDIHPGTKPSVEFIKTILDSCYNSGLVYDVSDLKQAIYIFAINSTNHSDYCMELVSKMHFTSEKERDNTEDISKKLVFFDVEVFPNLLLVNYKFQGKMSPVIRLINPTREEVEKLLQYNLVGFNCRGYDNHILYARLIGYSELEIYNLSQKIISRKSKDCFFREAYNLSYTDVLDFSKNKQSLKKFEIELGIHHKELGLPWDKPVPEEKWNTVAEYCDNDVIATEAVFDYLQDDFTARKVLADVAGMTVNDTTNSLTTRIIFGTERKPQSKFNYRSMGELHDDDILPEGFDEFTRFDSQNRPLFPGYKYEFGKSTYRGEEVGEGGYVYAEPGMYTNVALLDIASMHPSSIVAEDLFGEYTQNFKDILDSRIAIKHKDFERAKAMLGGKLSKYLSDATQSDQLAQALKIAINSVYGLTSAKFENPFRDPRNIDNIVAKRGALFMVNLKHEVMKRGYKVAHIKTDSIKIPDADEKIIQFVTDYGKMYGYNFEHEATYEKMCIVNDAVYIAMYKWSDKKGDAAYGSWTATGKQFQVPYVFKTLFSKEPIEFSDLCETKSVSTDLYLDFDEELPEGEHDYRFVGKVGLFCPIIPGRGGGTLLRRSSEDMENPTFASATGAKGFKWMEAEDVERLGKKDDIDRRYYQKLVDDAVKNISQYGDFEWFASDKEK